MMRNLLLCFLDNSDDVILSEVENNDAPSTKPSDPFYQEGPDDNSCYEPTRPIHKHFLVLHQHVSVAQLARASY